MSWKEVPWTVRIMVNKASTSYHSITLWPTSMSPARNTCSSKGYY